MYEFALNVHNVLRWVTILAVAFALIRALGGMSGRPYEAVDKRASMIATAAADLQLTVGLLLYFVWSPQVKSAMQDMGAAMKNPELRFWAVEHASMMLLAVAFVHVGKVLAKKAQTDAAKHKRIALWFGLALLLMLARTPWPGTTVARPWFVH